MARKVKAQLTAIFTDDNVKAAVITVNPCVFEPLVSGDWFSSLKGTFSDKLVYVVANSDVKPNSFKIGAQSGTILTLPDSAFLLT